MDLFISAIKKANIKTINEFLKAGYVNTEFKNRDGTLKEETETPLFTAITTGNLNIVDLLLDKGANKEAKNVKGETPLFAAIRSKQHEIVKLLLDKGADSEAKNPNDETPIFAAICLNQKEIVTLLLDKGANKEARNSRGETPLFYSIFCHNYLNPEKINPNYYFDLLVSKGANVNAKADNNYTPLTYAAVYNYNDLIKKLLFHGASIEDVEKVLLPQQIQENENIINKLKQIKRKIKSQMNHQRVLNIALTLGRIEELPTDVILNIAEYDVGSLPKSLKNLIYKTAGIQGTRKNNNKGSSSQVNDNKIINPFNVYKISDSPKGPNPFNIFNNNKKQGAINGSSQGGNKIKKRKTRKNKK